MKLFRLSVLLFIAISSAAANAQIGFYGKVDSTRVSAGNPNYEPTGWYVGPGAGVYYDFLRSGPIAIGGDLRGNLAWGNQQKYRSALFGLRLAVRVPGLRITPYVQCSVGAGGASHNLIGNSGTAYTTKLQSLVIGGVDYAVASHLELRVIEAGYGKMSGVGSGPGPAPASSLFTLSSGLVLRFP
jgi:hypothetical protein